MIKVITFGELMLRLNPPGYKRFTQTDSFDVSFGGGEANVAVSLTNLGIKAGFITKMPYNDIAQSGINQLNRYGVDTTKITRGGDRVGIYYLEKGASQRPSKVIYDRKYSAISTATEDDFDWDFIFKDANWFHFTGITPALGDNVAEICKKACKISKTKNITISCDLNYRKNLWSSEKAGNVMGELMEYVDVCIANEEDAEKVFGIKATETDITNGVIHNDSYKEVAKNLMDRFNFSLVAITLRESISASDNNWSAMLFDGKINYFSKKYPVHIIDRVGGGDSFAAGFIYGIINKYPLQEALELAVAASCLKHTIEGDFNLVSVAEVKALAGGDASGRVQR